LQRCSVEVLKVSKPAKRDRGFARFNVVTT
jgi:hypothetical protein